MQPFHRITVDVQRSLLRFELGGFFDDAAFGRFAADRAAAFRRRRCGPNEHLTLVDVSACLIQSQDMFGAFRSFFTDGPSRSRRMALVVGSSLARMQVRRLLAGRDSVACFERESEALAWLFDDGSRRAPGAPPRIADAGGAAHH